MFMTIPAKKKASHSGGKQDSNLGNQTQCNAFSLIYIELC